MAMTPKKEAFVREYISNGMNATEAAKKAGYSAKTAREQGCRLLQDVNVKAKIARTVEKAVTKQQNLLDYSVERTLNEIARLAFYDPRKFFESDGSVKQITALDDDHAACIAGMEVSDIWDGEGEQKSIVGNIKKIKLMDKGASLDKLMRYHSLYRDKIEHSGMVQLISDIPRPKRD